MRILVTGNLGYVGIPLCRELAAGGHSVSGVDVDWYRRCTLPEVAAGPVVPTLNRDLRDLCRSDLVGVECVIHLAGLSNDPLGDIDPDLTMQINAEAGIRLGRLAKSAGVRRMVALSSCSIYGAGGDQWLDEDASPAPLTAYAESKLALERGLLPLTDGLFEVVIARPGTVFGVAPKLRFDLVLNNLVAWAQATGVVRFLSDGSAWRPLLQVDDLARALAALATLSGSLVAGRAFNIGFDALNLRVRELGGTIVSALPGARVHFEPEACTDPRSYRVSCARLAQLWSPPHGPADTAAGVRDLLEVLTRNAISPEDFNGQRFQRVAHLRWLQQRGLLDAQLRG